MGTELRRALLILLNGSRICPEKEVFCGSTMKLCPVFSFSRLSVTQEKWGWGAALDFGEDIAGGTIRRGC